jgi:hypothetical protein
MASVYLYFNSALYLLFAIWCTLAPQKTAQSLGYSALSSAGRSEYLVIYGGLQFGLAILFALLARDPSLLRFGLKVSLFLYLPIVAYRIVTVWRFWPVPPLTLGTGVLEFCLLVSAASLLYVRP